MMKSLSLDVDAQLLRELSARRHHGKIKDSTFRDNEGKVKDKLEALTLIE